MELSFSQAAQGDWTRYAAVLSHDGGEPREMYMEIPSALERHVGQHYSNALLLLSVFECMKIGGDVYTDMPVEKQLADNMEEFSRVWAVWHPGRYTPISIKAETYCYAGGEDSEPRPDIAAYSGGVDSSYVVAHSLTPGTKPEIHLGAGVLIHGADIPLKDSEVFDRVFRQSEENLKGFGIPLYPVRTNIREYRPDWEETFYSVVTAALRLFSKTYGRGVIGTDETCDVNMLKFPWGGNPITDHMFSTAEFGNIPLGLTVGRTNRCRLISGYPALLRTIRVCWQSNANGGNCGVCEKCIRTKLNLMVCGVEGELPFRVPFSPAQVEGLPPADRLHVAFFRDILEYDATHGKVLSQEVKEAICRHIGRSAAFCMHAECVHAAPDLPFMERKLVACTRKGLTLLAKLRRLFRAG